MGQKFTLQPSPKGRVGDTEVPGYDQGGWVPALSGGTPTYDVQAGYYVKVGNFVFVQGILSVDTLSGANAYTITGLPYKCRLDGDAALAVSTTSNLATNVVSVNAKVNGGNTSITLLSRTAASASNTTLNNLFQDNSSITFSGVYPTDG